MDMKVTETADGITHVVLDGRFDIAGAQDVDSRLSPLAESSKILIVDLTKVSFIASLGVRTLMISAKTIIRRGADMAVCGANENVEKVLRSTGFNEVAGLYPDYASAVAALAGRAADFASKKS
jgi:anti-sigma B factor antagonist